MTNPIGEGSSCCWPFSLCCGKNKKSNTENRETIQEERQSLLGSDSDESDVKPRIPTPGHTPEKPKKVDATFYSEHDMFV